MRNELILCRVAISAGHTSVILLPRDLAEKPAGPIAELKPVQFVGCAVVLWVDPDGFEIKCLCYQRASNEPRLEGQWSILVGGHVGLNDVKTDLPWIRESCENATRRELLEELGVNTFSVHRHLWVKTDDAEVDKLHQGYVMICDLPVGVSRLAISNEKLGCSAHEWLTFDELSKKEGLESWSREVSRSEELRGAMLKGF